MAAAAPAAQAQVQEHVITGRVLSEAQAPLAGVNVVVEGLGIGTLTRDDGSYRLVVPAARVRGGQITITARLLGYRQSGATLTLSGATATRNFTLATNPLRLGEVVVTGSGTTARVEALGVATRTVDSTLLTRSNEQNLVAALAAKSPNLNITTAAGDPGASVAIRIRGIRTVQGTNQPLFVVDGSPVTNSTNSFSTTGGFASPNRISDFNPQDIENIEILSGPAASSIYGARGGNGAILITTKKGRSGRTNVTLRSSNTTDRIIKDYPIQTTYGLGLNGASTLCTTLNCGLGTGVAGSWGPRIPDGQQRWAWANELFGAGTNSDNVLQVSGGSDRTMFFASGGYNYNNGSIVGSTDLYKRATARINGSHRAFQNLNVAVNATYANTQMNGVGRGSNVNGLLLGAIRSPADWNNRDFLTADGLQKTFRFPNPAPGSSALNRNWDNPYWVIEKQENYNNNNRAQGNINTTWTPLGWLTVNHTLGADFNGEDRGLGLPQSSSGTLPLGQFQRWTINEREIDHILTVNAKKSLFNEKLRADVLVGQNLNDRNQQQLFINAQSLLAPGLYRVANTSSRDIPDDSEFRRRVESYFLKTSFDVYDRLFLTASIRNDALSVLSPGNQRRWFPGGSAAYTVVRPGENGYVPGLSYLKLRGSWGRAGIEPATTYQLQDLYIAGGAFGDAGFTDGIAAGQRGLGALYASATRGQPALAPQTSTETDVGADIGFLNDRITAGFSYFYNKTTDQIFGVPVPGSTGFNNVTRNSGAIRTRGFEVTANARAYQSRDFDIDVGALWGQQDPRVLTFGEGVPLVATGGGSFTGAAGAAVVGGRPASLRGSDFARCGRDLTTIGGNNIAAACQGAPAGALYIAADGFPILDATERTIADPTPAWTGGVNTSIRFKNVRLSSFLDMRRGGDVWNGTRGSAYAYGTHADTEQRATCTATGCSGNERVFGQNGWFDEAPAVGPGAGRAVPIGQNWYNASVANVGGAGLGGGFSPVATFLIEKGHFVRLREVTVGYNAKSNWLASTTGFSSVDLAISGRNLALWTDYKGYDPDTNLGGAGVVLQGIDFQNHPTTRSLVLTVSFNR